MIPDFASFSVSTNLAIFAGAATVVWLAGTKMASYADEIAERTGLGRAFIGFVLLALASSLPETSTIITAALRDSPALAVNDLFGSIVLQTVMLAAADLRFKGGALTFFTPRPTLLLQGTGLVALLSLALAAISAGPLLTFGWVSVWTPLLFAAWIACGWLLRRYEGAERWKATDAPESRHGEGQRRLEHSNARLGAYTVGAAAVLFGAGSLLATTADALAEQTGLGTGFVGATLVAFSTSLPELSTTLGAVRLRAYEMAVANVFGSNMANVALLFLADVVYRKGPILAAAGGTAPFVAAAGILVTSVYLGGLIERSDRTVGRLGVDSVVVVLVYAGFLLVSYLLR